MVRAITSRHTRAGLISLMWIGVLAIVGAPAVAQDGPAPSPTVTCAAAGTWDPPTPMVLCAEAIIAAARVLPAEALSPRAINFEYGNPCPDGMPCPLPFPVHGYVLFDLEPGPDLVVRVTLDPDTGTVSAGPPETWPPGSAGASPGYWTVTTSLDCGDADLGRCTERADAAIRRVLDEHPDATSISASLLPEVIVRVCWTAPSGDGCLEVADAPGMPGSITERIAVGFDGHDFTGLPVSLPAGSRISVIATGTDGVIVELLRSVDGITTPWPELLASPESQAGRITVPVQPIYAAAGQVAARTLPLDTPGSYLLGGYTVPPEDANGDRAYPSIGCAEVTVTGPGSSPGPVPSPASTMTPPLCVPRPISPAMTPSPGP